MSSTNKTSNLELNNWLGTDVPERADFNRDNSIIDNAINTHTSDGNIHISASERNKWNNTHYIGTYSGNGSTSRTVTVNSPFTPSIVIVYPINVPVVINDFSNSACYQYFGIATARGSTSGLKLEGNVLTVTQSPTPVYGNEYRSFNDSLKNYVYIAIR